MNKLKGVRIPEPDFTERTVVTVTPETYASRTFMEPTESYKRKLRQLKRNQRRK